MPWQEQTIVTVRKEFVTRAAQEGATIAALCRQYGISRKTGYKWLERAATVEGIGFDDRPRTPHHHPHRCAPEVEAAVLAMRNRSPTWGGRKLEVKLRETGMSGVPRPSTITAILQRHGRIAPRVRHLARDPPLRARAPPRPVADGLHGASPPGRGRPGAPADDPRRPLPGVAEPDRLPARTA